MNELDQDPRSKIGTREWALAVVEAFKIPGIVVPGDVAGCLIQTLGKGVLADAQKLAQREAVIAVLQKKVHELEEKLRVRESSC